uniref:hypothetical protein n=2 Tax=Citrobacter freundii TaxID=546 RepID=UPI003A977CA6
GFLLLIAIRDSRSDDFYAFGGNFEMKLSLDDETYAILREESDRLGMPVPRMIRNMCQNLAKHIQKRNEKQTNPQGENNDRDSKN